MREPGVTGVPGIPAGHRLATVGTVLALAVVNGCGGGGTDAGASAPDLAGKSFVATEVTGRELVPQSEVVLLFGEDSVAARAGCNTLTGGATWDDGVLRLTGEPATTMMACSGDLTRQDEWLAGLLRSEPAVRLAQVLGDDGVRLDGTTLVVGDGAQRLTLTEQSRSRTSRYAMDPAVTSLVVLVAAVGLFLWNRLPVGVVAILTALALYLTGVLDVGTALGGFGDPVVVFVASVFVVSEALDATGVTTWAGQVVTRWAGSGRVALTVALMLLAGVLTAVVSPNGAVAALLPMVVVVAVRHQHAPSQLLIPIAFAAHAGALLALSGSPVDMVVSGAAADAGAGRFGYVEFALVGAPLLVTTVAGFSTVTITSVVVTSVIAAGIGGG